MTTPRIMTLCSPCADKMKMGGMRVQLFTMPGAKTERKKACEMCKAKTDCILAQYKVTGGRA